MPGPEIPGGADAGASLGDFFATFTEPAAGPGWDDTDLVLRAIESGRALPELGLGVALKMDDGNNARAAEVVMAAVAAALLPVD